MPRLRLISTICALAAFGAAPGALAVSPTAPTVETQPEELPITKAAATAYARAVNLHARGLPHLSFNRELEEEVPLSEPGGEGKLAACAGSVGANSGLVDIRSPVFGPRIVPTTKRNIRVFAGSSEVRVMPSDALAVSDIEAIATLRGRSCFAESLYPGSHSRLKKVTTLSRPALPSGVRVVGLRVGIAPTRAELKRAIHVVRLYNDYYILTVGRAEITLSMIGVPRPPPTATEHHLLSLLYVHAVAHRRLLHAQSPGSPDAENGPKDGVSPTAPTVTVASAQSVPEPRGRAFA